MELLVLIVGLAVIGTLVWQGYDLGIMPVPTMPAMREAAIELMPPDPKLILELGSGWGGMTRRLQKAFPNAQVIGYERSFLPWLFSRLYLKTKRADIFYVDLSEADVVFTYLSPWHMQYLDAQFKTMKPGSTLVAVSFPIMDRQEDRKQDVGFTRVYAYTF